VTYPYPIDPGFSPPALPRKPTILERLFPDTSQGLLGGADLATIRRQQLVQLGARLLQSGGAQAQQGGTLANIGGALQGMDMQGAVETALRMKAYQQQQQQAVAQRQQLGALAEKYKHITDPYQRIRAMLGELAVTPGGEHLIGPLSNALAQLKPEGSRAEWSMPLPAVSQDGKTTGYYQVNRDTGETRQLNIKPPEGRGGRPVLKVIPGANGPEWAIVNADGELVPTGQPASLTEAQQRANALAGLVEDANKYLEGALAPNRIQQLTASKGLNEFLSANAEELEQASTQVADAYVRITSGAAAREEEYQRARKLITPYPGDNAPTLERKERARARMLAAIKRGGGIAEAGPAGGVPQPPPRFR